MPVTLSIQELRRTIVARLRQFFGEEDSELMADAVLFGELDESGILHTSDLKVDHRV